MIVACVCCPATPDGCALGKSFYAVWKSRKVLKGIFTAFIGVHLSSGCLIEAHLTGECFHCSCWTVIERNREKDHLDIPTPKTKTWIDEMVSNYFQFHYNCCLKSQEIIMLHFVLHSKKSTEREVNMVTLDFVLPHFTTAEMSKLVSLSNPRESWIFSSSSTTKSEWNLD